MRTATLADVARLREIDRASFAQDEQYNLADYRDMVSEPVQRPVVAVSPEGVIVGYVLLDLRKPLAKIRSLAVDPGYRKRGFAEALLRNVLLGRDRAELFVRGENASAIALYRKLGFVETPGGERLPGKIRMLYVRDGFVADSNA